MRTLTRGRLARALASALVAVFAGPLVMGWGLALPSFAQITTEQQLEVVAVLPFENLTKPAYQPEMLGDRTAAAVIQGLLGTQAFDVRPTAETKQKLTDLGLRLPLTETQLQRLGEEMNVGGVVFGEVRDVKIRTISNTREGEVVLMVAIWDVVTRTVRNGVVTVGHSSPVAAGSEITNDKLVDQALEQAVFQAVQQIRSFRPITGMVQYASGIDVTINKGDPDGVQETMQFVVLRNGARVGVIQITRALRSISDSHILQGEARTGDVVRQIVQIPASGSSTTLPVVKLEKQRSIGKILVGVGAMLLVALALGGSQSSARTVGSVSATAISNIADLSGDPVTNFLKTQPFGLVSDNPTGGGVQVRWSGSSNDLVAGYEVYRGGQLYWFVPATGNHSYTLATPIFGAATVDVSIPDSTTGIPAVVFTPTGAVSISGGVPPPGIVDGMGTDALTYTLRSDIGNDQNFTWYIGPDTASRVTFQIRRVVAVPVVSGTTPTRSYIFDNSGTLSAPVTVTYLGAPTRLLPADGDAITHPTAVNFSFTGSAGANQYMLQVSMDPAFAPSATRSQSLGFQPSAGLVVVTENLTSLLGSLPTGTVVFWRIGARSSLDTTKPLPYPSSSKQPTDVYRYVFSDAGHFTVQ